MPRPHWLQVPHFGLKGTQKPAHYHVICNDAELSADEIQALTFELCHTYHRATKASAL